ncbi:hypothetical protein AB6A40_011378 [Gnathostoma spinigerum]|uniref:Uncharacterized protein n=1 Tax=Gnathostoma spinigerum TaxID=75299 RepID=A0ABD6F1N0_9BILA
MTAGSSVHLSFFFIQFKSLCILLQTCTLANDPKLEKVEEKPEETTVAPKAAEETTVPPEAPKRCVPQGVWRIVTKYKYSENEEENEEKAFEILIQASLESQG